MYQIKLVKSPINKPKRQKATLKALGLRKLNQTVERKESDSLKGMIDRVSHLVEVTRTEETQS